MNQVGNIQCKNNKWRIFTHKKGFRPQWLPFNKDFVIKEIKNSKFDLYKNTWIQLIQNDQIKELKESVKDLKIPDMQYLINFINTLSMVNNVNFKKPENEDVT